MYSCINFKSSRNLQSICELQEFCKYNTSSELDSQVDHSPKKLISVLNSLLTGSLTGKHLFPCSPVRHCSLKRQTSIQNLQFLSNEPMVPMRTSLSVFSQRFSAFNLDRELSASSYLLTISCMDEPKDFECNCHLSESDIRQIFGNGDWKVMVTAVAVMCKYLSAVGEALTQATLWSVFAVSSIVTFKMAYDTELTGLMREFASRMGLEVARLQRMEAAFLRAIDYDLNISGNALSTVMTWFI